MANHQPEIDLVDAFNAAINARDLDRVIDLMAEGHRFVDSSGDVVEGRAACAAAWASFFDSFPDYRNVFVTMDRTGPGRVVVEGWSECSFEPLRGAARWHVQVHDGRVVEWRVEDPAASGPGAAESGT